MGKPRPPSCAFQNQDPCRVSGQTCCGVWCVVPARLICHHCMNDAGYVMCIACATCLRNDVLKHAALHCRSLSTSIPIEDRRCCKLSTQSPVYGYAMATVQGSSRRYTKGHWQEGAHSNSSFAKHCMRKLDRQLISFCRACWTCWSLCASKSKPRVVEVGVLPIIIHIILEPALPLHVTHGTGLLEPALLHLAPQPPMWRATQWLCLLGCC